MESVEAVWNQVTNILKPRVDPHHFRSYLLPIRPQAWVGNHFVLEAPNQRFVDWLNAAYLELIQNELSTITGREMKVRIVPRNDNGNGGSPTAPSNPFNNRYLYKNFVVGRGNSTAYAAARAVAEHPGRVYNPLYIYSASGLGKTHLLHAIGNDTFNSRPDLKIAYVTGEDFLNEFVQSIRYERSEELRNKYRNLDVLLVDDVQFLAGKEATLIELFHTFNTLYNNNKQVVFTSDRPPTEINLDERLVTRFEWGLVIDIQPPDIETRIAIIEAKSEIEGVELPDDVVDLIAQRVRSNIRTIEGAILRLSAFAAISEKPITLKMAREVLSNILGRETPKVSIETIQRTVCNHFEISMKQLLDRGRKANISFARQVAMYLSRNLTDAKLGEIGLSFGGRDHSTVIHSYNKVRDLVERDPDNAALISKLERLAASGDE